MSSKPPTDIPQLIFKFSAGLLGLGFVFGLGVIAHSKDLPPIPQLKTAYKAFSSEGGIARPWKFAHLQPSRDQGDGVTVNTIDDGALVSLVGFFDEENQIRLVTRDGSVVHKWSLDYFEHFPDVDERVCNLQSSLGVDMHGAHITSDGDLVVNYEYCGTVKLDQCGALQWSISEPTHHSLIPAEAGGYWILGRYQWKAIDDPDRLPPFSTPGTDQLIDEDSLMRVSEDGKIIDEYSIPQLMIDNGLEPILTANGEYFGLGKVRRGEIVHANKAAELTTDIADQFPLFAAGDIAVSMRELNMVMVFDPVSKVVKWHQIGPWLRQHDPEFMADGRISIFNNNTYRTDYIGQDGQTDLTADFATNIIAVDPVTGESSVVFGQREGQEMLSVVRGQHELLDNDGMIISEFDGGRVLQVNAAGEIVWEYVNRYDDDFVGEITNSDVYPADYFNVDWQSCS